MSNFCQNARLSFKFSMFYIAGTIVDIAYFSRLFPGLCFTCSISELFFITFVPCFVGFFCWNLENNCPGGGG